MILKIVEWLSWCCALFPSWMCLCVKSLNRKDILFTCDSHLARITFRCNRFHCKSKSHNLILSSSLSLFSKPLIAFYLFCCPFWYVASIQKTFNQKNRRYLTNTFAPRFCIQHLHHRICLTHLFILVYWSDGPDLLHI